jgi:hypothetical protein
MGGGSAPPAALRARARQCRLFIDHSTAGDNMAKWDHADVLDAALNYIKANATVLHVVKAYSPGDAYATVVANSVCSVAVASADFTLADAAAAARSMATAAKNVSGTAASGPAPDLHFAFVNAAASKVLWVTDETSNAVIAIGNPVSIPALLRTQTQPT